jgi:hypothetical protein
MPISANKRAAPMTRDPQGVTARTARTRATADRTMAVRRRRSIMPATFRANLGDNVALWRRFFGAGGLSRATGAVAPAEPGTLLSACYRRRKCPLGETGRRKGLKIPWLATAMPVRVRQRAPKLWRPDTPTDQNGARCVNSLADHWISRLSPDNSASLRISLARNGRSCRNTPEAAQARLKAVSALGATVPGNI